MYVVMKVEAFTYRCGLKLYRELQIQVGIGQSWQGQVGVAGEQRG